MKEAFALKGDFKKHAEKAIREFCPQRSDFDKIGLSDILRRSQMLFESVWNIYHLDVRCWNKDQKDFLDFVSTQLINACTILFLVSSMVKTCLHES